jgi:FkbM family methyltransferase
VTWRRAVIGRPESPSRLATFLHNLLNQKPPAEGVAFACKAPLDGYQMHIDWSQFRSFVYGTWEPKVVSSIVSTVQPGMTAVDIGAHIGYYTLLLAKRVGPTGRVFAFEPLPVNFALLQKNIELNRLQRVQTFPQAVFSRDVELTLTVPDDLPNSGNASLVGAEGTKRLRVPAVTLDSVSAGYGLRPDFLKIDVEGAELDVLLGAKETLARSRPKMLIELHHFDGNLEGHPVPGLLTSWRYDIQWIERWAWTSHILALPRPALDGVLGTHYVP